MAREKLSFSNEAKKCYSVKEIDCKAFFSKVIKMCLATSNDESIIELRLDYLINKNVDVNEIIDGISVVQKLLKLNGLSKQFIATIRNFSNGGNCLINDEKYLEVVEALYEKSSIDAIDIDYDFYNNNASKVKKIFSGKKTLIITYTCLDRVMSLDEYREVLKTLCKTPAYVIKVEAHAFSFDDTENLMNATREYASELAKNSKQVVAISLGRLGIVSRIWYEYTNSKIIYIDNDEDDIVSLGNINESQYNKYRDILRGQEEFSNFVLKNTL